MTFPKAETLQKLYFLMKQIKIHPFEVLIGEKCEGFQADFENDGPEAIGKPGI